MNSLHVVEKANGYVWQELGEKTLAPLLHDFALWLHKEATRNGIEHLFFLARDGYMLQRAYQAVIPKEEQIQNEYMFASRRLFNFAAIRKIDAKALRFLMGDRVIMPVESYLERIGLNAGDCSVEIERAGFSNQKAVVERSDFKKLHKLFIKLEPKILKASAAERNKLLTYANGLANWNSGHCAVVDAGWHGSLQASLGEVLELKPDQLHGYYLGLLAEARLNHRQVMSAYLDENRSADRLTCWRTFRRCFDIFEIFFTGRESSIVGIEENGPGQFEAVRETYEMPAEVADNLDRLQTAAMDTLLKAKYTRREVRRRLRMLLSHPTRAEAEALGNVPHMEGIGGYGRFAPLARPRYRLMGYLQHPGQLITDWRKAFWRPGFVRRLY